MGVDGTSRKTGGTHVGPGMEGETGRAAGRVGPGTWGGRVGYLGRWVQNESRHDDVLDHVVDPDDPHHF